MMERQQKTNADSITIYNTHSTEEEKGNADDDNDDNDNEQDVQKNNNEDFVSDVNSDQINCSALVCINPPVFLDCLCKLHFNHSNKAFKIESSRFWPSKVQADDIGIVSPNNSPTNSYGRSGKT